jgi:hypothetical protein
MERSDRGPSMRRPQGACRGIVLAVLLLGCKKEPAPAGTPTAAAPAWKIESQPIELPCGDQPLALPPPAPGAEPAAARPLAPAPPIAACHDLASVAAVCSCLAAAPTGWAQGVALSPAAECAATSFASPEAQIVEVRSHPADLAATAGGQAFVLVAKHGATWSALAVIDGASDVDLTTTPKLSQRAAITRFEQQPIAAGALVWIESRTESQERSMGDLDRDGAARGTICVLPAAAAPSCFAPLEVGAWTYAFTVAKADSADACTAQKVVTYAATITAGAAELRVAHGADADRLAGRYRLP